jgi:hypothetical protein
MVVAEEDVEEIPVGISNKNRLIEIDPSTVCFQTENRSAQDDMADLKSLSAMSNKKL